MDAIYARFITCGGDDASVSAAADNERFATKGRIITLFNGRVKRVHVDVQDVAMF